MELIKTLEKVKSYLIQGSYQGAVHVLDGAIVEAESIQSECEMLRVRVGEMAAEIERLNVANDQITKAQIDNYNMATDAWDENKLLRSENARLQSIIDEANAQEPNCWRVSHRSFCGTTTDSKEIAEDPFYDGCVINLYSRPIPVQPSPAVAVPDDWRIVEKKTCYALICGNEVIATLAGSEAQENAAIIAKLLASPRIAEQDVREILDAYWNSTDDCGDWLKSVDGRALLNKLNGRYERG